MMTKKKNSGGTHEIVWFHMGVDMMGKDFFHLRSFALIFFLKEKEN